MKESLAVTWLQNPVVNIEDYVMHDNAYSVRGAPVRVFPSKPVEP